MKSARELAQVVRLSDRFQVMKKRDVEDVGAMAKRIYQDRETARNAQAKRDQKVLEQMADGAPAEEMYPDPLDDEISDEPAKP